MALPLRQETKTERVDRERTVALRLEELTLSRQAASAATRRRERAYVGLAFAAVIGVLVGIGWTRAQLAPPPLVPALLNGTWELQSIGKDGVGARNRSVILSHHVVLQDGRLSGETHLRGDSDAAIFAMPFPAESVQRVAPSPDGREIHVYWKGTYQIAAGNYLELRLGSAFYRLKADWNPKSQSLTTERDVILTYPGAATYRKTAAR